MTPSTATAPERTTTRLAVAAATERVVVTGVAVEPAAALDRGRWVSVVVTVANADPRPHRSNVEIAVPGERPVAERVTVPPGDTRRVEWILRADAVDARNVSARVAPAVDAAVRSPASAAGPAAPGFTVPIVLVAVVAVVALLARTGRRP